MPELGHDFNQRLLLRRGTFKGPHDAAKKPAGVMASQSLPEEIERTHSEPVRASAPMNVARGSAEPLLQTVTAPSARPDRIRVPSRENAIDLTEPSCPENFRTSCPSLASKSTSAPFLPAASTERPSGET